MEAILEFACFSSFLVIKFGGHINFFFSPSVDFFVNVWRHVCLAIAALSLMTSFLSHIFLKETKLRFLSEIIIAVDCAFTGIVNSLRL